MSALIISPQLHFLKDAPLGKPQDVGLSRRCIRLKRAIWCIEREQIFMLSVERRFWRAKAMVSVSRALLDMYRLLNDASLGNTAGDAFDRRNIPRNPMIIARFDWMPQIIPCKDHGLGFRVDPFDMGLRRAVFAIAGIFIRDPSAVFKIRCRKCQHGMPSSMMVY